MKKAKRILALLLAVIMIATGSSITAFGMSDRTPPQEDENGKFYFTYSQAGTWIMDTLDDLLDTLLDGKELVNMSVLGIDIYVALYSYEATCSSISGTWDEIKTIVKIAGLLLGDLPDLKPDALGSYVKRNDTNKWDYECLYTLLHFLYDNRTVLQNIVAGTFDWGVLESTIADVEDGLLMDLGGFLQNLLYTTFEDLAGKEEGTAGSGTTATTYDPDGKDVDGSLQDLVSWLLIDNLGLPITADKVDVRNVSTYDLVNNLIDCLLENMVVPLLKDVLMDAFDIDVTPEYPEGDPEKMNDTTLTMVFGIVEGLMTESETKPDYSGCQYPGEKIETLLNWFFREGGMDQYILINEDGISIQDGFVDLLNNLIRLAIPLVYNLGFDTLPKDMIYTTEQLNLEPGQEGYISNASCYAQLLKILFSSPDLIRGSYCDVRASSISEVGAYALASMCARIVPEYDYYDMLAANYEGGTKTTLDGRTVSAMPFNFDYTAKGQVLNGSTWTEVTRTYTIPYAALDMGVTVGVFFLDGLITADFSQVPDSVANPDAANTASATVRFEKFLKVLVDWAVDKYLPLFNVTYNLKTRYPNPSDVWKELDEVLFGLIPRTWLPESVTDRTMEDQHDALGCNGSATVRLDSLLDLICGWLLGSVMDLDLQELLGILQRNTSANADFNKPLLTVLIDLIDRVFYVVFAKYCLLPTAGTGRNAYSTRTNIVGLSSGGDDGALLSGKNLGGLIYHLCYRLGSGTNTFNATTIAEPILATALPLIMGLTYVKPFRDTAKLGAAGVLSQGEITVDDLRNLIDTVSLENKCEIPYAVANVDSTTTGTYYTVSVVNDSATGAYTPVATAVTLPADYDPAVTYYTNDYQYDSTVDRFTSGTYYTKQDVFESVVLDGTNYDPTAKYCDTAFTEVAVDASSNGTYFVKSGDAYSAAYLPESYVEGTTYYTHNEVNLGASSTGTYLKKVTTYTPVTLTGVSGNNFVPGKWYYEPASTTVKYTIIDSYDEDAGLLAYGVYNVGSADTNGIGTYSSSIPGQTFYITRDQEDFPDKLFAYNNYENFIEDAEDFINDYKSFVNNDIPEAAAEWKAYLSGATDKVPDAMYPYYLSNNAYDIRVDQLELTVPGGFNNLQVMKDCLGLYGTDAFITPSTPNSSGTALAPILTINRSDGASKAQIAIYEGFKEYIEAVQEYSDNLNNYYDGINYYLTAAEQGRKSYQETSPKQVEWLLDFCAEAYNNGVNGTFSDGAGDKTYTDKSYETFRHAYKAAEDLVNQINLRNNQRKTTQSQCSWVRESLIMAYYGLVRFGELADTTQLYSYIVTARRIKAAEQDITGTDDATYTSQSFDALLAMLDAAVEVYETGYGSDEQDVVDANAARLNAAINALVYLAAPGIEVNDDYVPEEGETPVDIGETWVNNAITYGYIFGIAEIFGLKSDAMNNGPIKPVGIAADGVTLNATSYGPGTGSYIIGKAAGDITKFRFTAILFGDVNGDARIDGTDKTAINAYALGAASDILNEAQLVAADVDGNGHVDASDAAGIQQVIDYEATISQAADVDGSRIVAAL